MPSLRSIDTVFRGSAATRATRPAVPAEIAAVRQAQLDRAGDKGWTGLNFMTANSAKDVKEHLGEERDAARILASANVPMFLLRYAYGTGKGMEAWLHQKPADGKLKLTVATMPSWHAGAPGASTASSALLRAVGSGSEVPKLDKAQVLEALKNSGSFGKLVADDLVPLDRAASWFVQNYDSHVSSEKPDAAGARKFIGTLMAELGTQAMGEKFSKENIYTVSIRLPDGQTIRKRFDVEGNDPPQPGRKDTAHNATSSPEIEIDISAFAGKKIVIQAWPDGSAGVGGYKEAREITLHL